MVGLAALVFDRHLPAVRSRCKSASFLVRDRDVTVSAPQARGEAGILELADRLALS